MSILLLETEVFFPVSILVRKPMQIKWFLHFLRFGEESEKNCSKVTVIRPSGFQAGIFFCRNMVFLLLSWYNILKTF